MNERVEAEIISLEQLVSRVVSQSRNVASFVDVEAELLEELQQITIALHYTIQTLRLRLGFQNAPDKNVANTKSSSDLRIVTSVDNLPLETNGSHIATQK